MIQVRDKCYSCALFFSLLFSPDGFLYSKVGRGGGAYVPAMLVRQMFLT